MKSIIKVCNMRTAQDVSSIRKAISGLEGIVACQIAKDRGEVDVVYDNHCISEENIVEAIEDLGYTASI